MAIRSSLFLIFGTLSTLGNFAFAANRCDSLVSSAAKAKLDGTPGFIAYLGALVERQIIGDQELASLIDGFGRGIVANPISEEKAWLSSSAMIHREELQEYIERFTFDKVQLEQWARNNLKEKSRVQVRRHETRSETDDIHHKMEFHPIPPGRFRMGFFGRRAKAEVRLTHTIEMMTTKVTKKMWTEIMGTNSIAVEPRELDHPVRVTWWSALALANRMSEKMGLKPAYDFSQMKWSPDSSAEAGTLRPDNSSEADKLKINSPSGKIYDAEGYRLPTEAEQEYLQRNLGRSEGAYPFGISESDVKDYAWYEANSGRKIQPVGTTAKSFVVNGKEFHDVIGNVEEWGNDRYYVELQGGENPEGSEIGRSRVLRGGSSYSRISELQAGAFDADYVESRAANPGAGVRLVRTLK